MDAEDRELSSREFGRSFSLGDDGPIESLCGDELRTLEEADLEGANDCSNGLGSRSKSERFCRVVGNREGALGEWALGDWLFGDMTIAIEREKKSRQGIVVKNSHQ